MKFLDSSALNRREALRRAVLGAAALPAALPLLAAPGAQPVHNASAPPYPAKREFPLEKPDHLLLESVGEAAFRFFWENSHPKTGLTKDRTSANGTDERTVASIAATGYGLAACCIAAQRGWHPGSELRDRVRRTLRWVFEWMPHEHGFYYHFIDWSNGRRMWDCELSSIDSAIFLCGVILCGEYFVDPEIRDLSAILVQRVDWNWMMNEGATLTHGWKPDIGFLPHRWDHYSELMMLYLLAMGTDNHRIGRAAWDAWRRPKHEYFGLRYIGSPAPLFVHQFSHAWFDFHGVNDRYANYFDNSLLATEAHRRFCLDYRDLGYREDLWGITASDSVNGYTVWGGPPTLGPVDGTVVPCAAAGSLPFLPGECLRVLHTLKAEFGDRLWQRYGFADAFNPRTGWVARDVIGIDLGITLLMAENVRTGFVWDTFKKNKFARQGMERANFSRAQHVRRSEYQAR